MKTAALACLVVLGSAGLAGADPMTLEDQLAAALRQLVAAGPDGKDGATVLHVLQDDVVRGIELSNETGNAGSLATFTTAAGMGTLALTGANAGESALLSINYLATGMLLDLGFPADPTLEIHLGGVPVGGLAVGGFYADTDGNRGVWKAPANGHTGVIHLVPEDIDPVDLARIREIQIDLRLTAMSNASLVLDAIRLVPEPGTGAFLLACAAVLGLRRR